MSELERFGISVDGKLLEEFDKRNKQMGYTNRSEAIRDLIRDCLIKKKHWAKDNIRVAATVTLVYNHHTTELNKKLNEIQHEHAELIVACMHVHLDAHNCLEVIILRGMSGQIKQLAHKLIAQKGVKHGKAILTSEGNDPW